MLQLKKRRSKRLVGAQLLKIRKSRKLEGAQSMRFADEKSRILRRNMMHALKSTMLTLVACSTDHILPPAGAET